MQDGAQFTKALTLLLDHPVRYDLRIGRQILKTSRTILLEPKLLDTVLRAKIGSPSARN